MSWKTFKTRVAESASRTVKTVKNLFIKKSLQTENEFYKPYVDAANEHLRSFSLSVRDVTYFVTASGNVLNNLNNAIDQTSSKNYVKDEVKRKLINKTGAGVLFTLQEAECLFSALFRHDSLNDNTLYNAINSVLSGILAKSDKVFNILVGLERKQLLCRSDVYTYMDKIGNELKLQLLNIYNNPAFIDNIFTSTGSPDNAIDNLKIQLRENWFTQLKTGLRLKSQPLVNQALNNYFQGNENIEYIGNLCDEVLSTVPRAPGANQQHEAGAMLVQQQFAAYDKVVDAAITNIEALLYPEKMKLREAIANNPVGRESLKLLNNMREYESNLENQRLTTVSSRNAVFLDRGPLRLFKTIPYRTLGRWLVHLAAIVITAYYGAYKGGGYLLNRFVTPLYTQSITEQLQEFSAVELKRPLTEEEKRKKINLLENYRKQLLPSTIKVERAFVAAEVTQLETNKILSAENAEFLRNNPGILKYLKEQKTWELMLTTNGFLDKAVTALKKAATEKYENAINANIMKLNKLTDHADKDALLKLIKVLEMEMKNMPLLIYFDRQFEEDVKTTLAAKSEGEGKPKDLAVLERKLFEQLQNALDTEEVIPQEEFFAKLKLLATDVEYTATHPKFAESVNANQKYLTEHPEVKKWMDRLLRNALPAQHFTAFLNEANYPVINDMYSIVRIGIGEDEKLLSEINDMGIALAKPLDIPAEKAEMQKIDEKIRGIIKALEDRVDVSLSVLKVRIPIVTQYDKEILNQKKIELAENKEIEAGLMKQLSTLREQERTLLKKYEALTDNKSTQAEEQRTAIDRELKPVQTRIKVLHKTLNGVLGEDGNVIEKGLLEKVTELTIEVQRLEEAVKIAGIEIISKPETTPKPQSPLQDKKQEVTKQKSVKQAPKGKATQ